MNFVNVSLQLFMFIRIIRELLAYWFHFLEQNEQVDLVMLSHPFTVGSV